MTRKQDPTVRIAQMKNLADKIVPVAPVVSSHQAGWNNIFLAYYQQPACEIPKHYLSQHTFTICSELGNPSLIECCLDERLKRYYFQGGDIIFCPALVGKSLVWKQRNSCILLALEPQLVEQVAYESLDPKHIEFTPQFKIVDPLIQHLAYALKSELESGCLSGRLYGESAAAMLAVHLLKINSPLGKPIQEYRGGLPTHKLAQVVEYIDEYLAQNIGLSELAQVVDMSQYHFARLFKQSVGITPHQYLIRQRVERAKQLLRQRDLSIADVAVQCGFANQGHLGYHFKRLVNTTPKAFVNSSKNL
ncbi:AraC family transcriptional regulator [Chroococcidiopsis sp. CCALA 051]|uniref:AraC family transcriptional regulator n=1 Tax=Chroococcidiopsis sp. CCALA 051 TaxID=869949 RepID=UPI000D0D5049|nr:AraC family transcriptional regulator [Chroococcidiopsis sp. CCALA 051]MBE9015826.1 helix-turn-helix transcriptional regulator [Chroococcidiopsidales cyanobacterium LEGE 13417]PSM49126.1 AraC family transcriptional regulator [Chroococcidiopsis sp. CCALA 051]